MPSDPRIRTDPTLEELSAYIDHELDAASQARVADHVAGCAECRTRLDGLRQTAHAVRALPMQTPPRTFRIPAQRQQSFRWAPVGWLGSAAAALLVIVFGIQQLHLPGGTPSSAGTAQNYYNGSASQSKSTGQGAAAPGATNQNQPTTAERAALDLAASPNQVTVVDPRNSARRLTVGTDQATYAANGRILVTGLMAGDSSASTGQLRLVLRRGGYGVQLGSPTGAGSGSAGFRFEGAYTISNLPLANPSAGSYTLTVTWTASDGSGATLIAELPVTITG